MASVTQATKKTTRQPVCKHCSIRFRTTSINAIYCSRNCKERATTQKRQSTQISRATNSTFFYWLAAECERAGTLEVLRLHTVESLVTLYGVYKLWLKANGYGDYKKFEISHVSPVKGKGTLGLLHPDNLIVAPLKMNRSHGVKHFAHGKSILRAEIDHRYAVDKGSSRKGTIDRIVKFIGAEVVTEVVRIAKIQPTQRYKVIAWLLDHLDSSIPEHCAHLATLDSLSTKALTKLKATLLDKEGVFSPASFYMDEFTVLMSEWERVAHSCRADLLPAFQRFQSVVADLIPTDELLQALFNMLHGRDDTTVTMMMDATRELSDTTAVVMEDIPATVQIPPMRTTVASLSLDGIIEAEMPYMIPVLNMGGYIELPDPWTNQSSKRSIA